MKKGVIIGLLLMVVGYPTVAQLDNHVFIGPQFGLMHYTGDLVDRATPQSNTIHPFGGLSLKVKNLNRFSIRAGLILGRLSAADSINNPNSGRDFHFRSNITEFQVLGKVNFFNHQKKARRPMQIIVTPGFVGGFSLFHFNPQVIHDGTWIDARDLGTEGQFVGGDTYEDPYNRLSASLKTGLEVNVRITDLIEVDFFTLYTKTFTDHIDDVGGFYPEVEDLLNTNQGQLAAEFAFRDQDPNNIRPAGSARGNPDKNDGFFQMGMTLNFRLTPVPRNRYNSRPAFKRRRPTYF